MVTIEGIGRVGREPKMQYSDKGNAITHVTVAFEGGMSKEKDTTWVDLVAFGKQAEILNQYLTKGNRLHFVAEFLKLNMYDKQDGSKGVSVDAKVLQFSFIDVAKQSGEPEVF